MRRVSLKVRDRAEEILRANTSGVIMTLLEAVQQAKAELEGPEKSRGHIAFAGQFEYFHAAGDVYRAPTAYPIMTDGRRCGRFECSDATWERFGARLLMAAR